MLNAAVPESGAVSPSATPIANNVARPVPLPVPKESSFGARVRTPEAQHAIRSDERGARHTGHSLRASSIDQRGFRSCSRPAFRARAGPAEFRARPAPAKHHARAAASCLRSERPPTTGSLPYRADRKARIECITSTEVFHQRCHGVQGAGGGIMNCPSNPATACRRWH